MTSGSSPPCNLKILSLRETQFVSRGDNLFIAVGTSLNHPEIWIFPCGKRAVSFQSSSRSCRGAWKGARDARARVARRASSVCSRWYRCAQPPAIYGFFPAGKGVGSWQISDFSHQRAARSCRGAWKGARDAGMCASHVRKIKEGASESMNPLFIG